MMMRIMTMLAMTLKKTMIMTTTIVQESEGSVDHIEVLASTIHVMWIITTMILTSIEETLSLAIHTEVLVSM